jgi:protein SCO1/2
MARLILAFLAAAALAASGEAQAHGATSHDKAKAVSAAPAAESRGSAPAPLPLDIGGSFTLVDHTGRAVTDADFRGDYLLVFFGYANCTGICPTGLRAMTAAVDLLGSAGARVQPLLITVDPESDTPETLGPAVARIHPRLIGLTGTPEALAAARRVYRTSARPVGTSWQGTKLFEHGSFIYLMGPDGGFLTLFPPVMPSDDMAAAIRGYLG